MEDKNLLACANKAKEKAYAPIQVSGGSSPSYQGGRSFQDAQVENSSYGLTNCAERTAVFCGSRRI